MIYATIDEVLQGLDHVIDVARRRGSADGYFAALYRRVTAGVKGEIGRGSFDDGARMERFDVLFASRYLDAWNGRERGERTSSAWNVALGCSCEYWPVVLQHLLVGMNAHINLDLGIAAAEVAPGTAIQGLERDFNAINRLLAGMVNDVQDRLASVWPAMRLLDRAGHVLDEAVVNFSIQRARDQAWRMACSLAALPAGPGRDAFIQRVDTECAGIGRSVLHPGPALALKLAFIRVRERGAVTEKIDVLLKP